MILFAHAKDFYFCRAKEAATSEFPVYFLTFPAAIPLSGRFSTVDTQVIHISEMQHVLSVVAPPYSALIIDFKTTLYFYFIIQVRLEDHGCVLCVCVLLKPAKEFWAIVGKIDISIYLCDNNTHNR